MVDGARRRFDASYEERVVLDDRTRVTLRLIRPEDKALLRAAWQRLSPESRYRRFLSPKLRLSDAELRYLTEIDNEHHVAIGAVREGGEGGEGATEGAGIARFICLGGSPDTAEAAIVVTDDMQGKGLGRLLLSRLAAAAHERGVKVFRCDVLTKNDAMRRLLFEIAPSSRERPDSDDGETVEIDVPVEEMANAGAPAGPLYRLFRLFAERALALERTLAELGAPRKH